MSDWRARAFDQVNEITKQILTLATAIITLTITFFRDFATHGGAGAEDTMAWGWGLYVVSIVFGIGTLMASAGQQQEAADNSTQPTINAGNLRFMGIVQLGAFSVGIILTVIAGIIGV